MKIITGLKRVDGSDYWVDCMVLVPEEIIDEQIEFWREFLPIFKKECGIRKFTLAINADTCNHTS